MSRWMMILTSLVLSLPLILLAQQKSSARKDPQKQKSELLPFQATEKILPNGLKIIVVPTGFPNIASIQIPVQTGSRNEVEPGKSGFAHFFEHMMFRGTEKYGKDKYNDVLKSIGADNNAFTTDDYTTYHTLASAEALETIMDLESDRFMNLKYSEEAFKTEAGAILGEYNKNYSSPFLTIFEKLRNAAYTVHTYKHTTMGFLKDIMDMPNQYQYSLTFFDRWYRPEYCTVLIVGDVQHDKTVAMARKYYGKWKRGNYVLDVPKEPPQTKGSVVEMSWKAETLPILAIGYHGPAFSDAQIDMPAMDVLSQALFSQSSNLFRKLVIEEQAVEFVQGGQQDSRDPGQFTIFTRIKDPKIIQKVSDEIDGTIEEAKTTPVSAERLAEIKSFLKYSYAMGLDNADAIARSIVHYIAMTGDPESVNKVYALYDRVTAEDLMAVASKYFDANNRTVVLLTQEGAKQ